MKHKLITLFFVLAVSVGTMFAERVQIGDLYYNLDATNQTAKVTYQEQWSENNYSGLTSANIPSSVTYNEAIYSITSIGDYAFYNCTGLTSIEIPDSVISIGSSAFGGCTGLTSIEIPNSVTNIGGSAFSGCTGLTSVTLNSDSIVGASYSYYSNIGSFFGSQVKEYIIGENVKSIGKNAFSGCTGLISIEIPNSVTSIGKNAFSGCTGLTSIEIPNSVTSIGEYAFSGCTGLTSPIYNKHVFVYMPTSYSNAYSIPDGIESIAVGAFRACTGLTSIIIPNSVTSIEHSAFYGCSGLISIDIPNSVTSIGEYAFYNCTGITSITIPNSVTSIEKYTFSDCTGLISTDIPNSVTNIGESAFKGCTGLTSVEIPNSVISIEKEAFSGCTGLTSVTIPNNVKNIGNRAFYDCYNLSSVNIPNSVISIGSSAFGGVQNINYTGTASGLPWGAKRLNGERIYSVEEIKNIASRLSSGQTSDDYYRFTGVISSIENVNTTYGNATFYIRDAAITTSTFYCYRIHDYHSTLFTNSNQLSVGDVVVISSKVQNYKGTTPEATLGRLVYHSANPLFTPDSIFYYGHRKDYPNELKLYEAIDIDTLDIPSTVSYNGQNYTVTEMASGAFYNKENLKCVKLPKTLKLMPRAFEKCSNIQSLYFNARNLEQQTTIPFAESNTTLRTIYIGENVSSLPHEFFNNLTNITSVYWNAIACYDMQYSPFYYSRNSIRDFIIANNIEYIPANMCWGMTNLVEFKIPSRVTAIGKDAFHGCTGLTSLSLGENITSYGDSVFAGCSALTSIYNYRERPAQLSIGTFDGIDYFNCTLYVPEGSVDMYKSSGSDWKDFYFVEPLPAEVIDSHLEYDAEDVDFIVDFDSYELDASTLANGYSWLTAVNEKRQVIQMLMVFPSGKTELVAGTYPVEATGIFQSVYAGQGLNEQGNIIGSFACNIDNEGYVIDPFWYLVSGTVIVDVDGNIDVDAVNSYNRTIRCHLRKASEAVEDVTAEKANGTIKHLRDGQVLILRGDKTYTLQGQEVK